MGASVCHEPPAPALGDVGEPPQATAANPSAAPRAPMRFIPEMYTRRRCVGETPPPYQVAVYFPGSDAVRLRSSHPMNLRWIEFLMRDGRAVAYPVYQPACCSRVGSKRGPFH